MCVSQTHMIHTYIGILRVTMKEKKGLEKRRSKWKFYDLNWDDVTKVLDDYTMGVSTLLPDEY